MLSQCNATRPLWHCLLDKELHMRIPVRLIPGMYDIFLGKWLDVFPPGQVLVLRNEDYALDMKKNIKAVFTFLGLDPLPEAELDRISKLPRMFEKTEKDKQLGQMLNKTRRILDKFYAPFNRNLAGRLHNDKFLWSS
ncbi:carbohydrate sulfotransferase 15-like [Aplysia californica]|uniref:Carbohydrate sulfotransferase 15-like n=1 Tax=Aplysia californica TaxID=6500 RepID=A0ABM1A6N1_APLCA|nr:carbohydrate sulfotransferase 15-like [Aplysia californica]